MNRSTIIAGLAMLGFAASGLAGCGRGNAGDAARAAGTPTAILGAEDVATVKRTDLATGVPLSGTLQPGVDIRIAAPIPEMLEEVLVKEGQAVRRNQVLARFRTSAIAPAAASADAHERVAAADFQRMQNLYKEGAIALRDVESAEAALRAAEAERAAVEKKLAEAEVRAPVDGVVATRFVQAGNRVMEGDALFRLVNTRELELEATVPGEAAPVIATGAAVVLDVAGYPAGSVGGRVARVNATADPATRQVKVYVTVPNPGGRMVGDLYASGHVVTTERRATLAIPGAGVRTDADGRSYAWVVAGGALARRPVTVGLRDESRDLVEILGGLAEGDSAVVGHAEGLKEGQKVTVTGGGA
jgi:membrane fusion protein, multidrug efflux system